MNRVNPNLKYRKVWGYIYTSDTGRHVQRGFTRAQALKEMMRGAYYGERDHVLILVEPYNKKHLEKLLEAIRP